MHFPHKIVLFALYFALFIFKVSSRKHKLVLEQDIRKYFSISTFGFFEDGELEVKLNHLTYNSKFNTMLGFTLTKTISDSITPYMESHQTRCLLEDDLLNADGNIQIVSFRFDIKNNRVIVNCSNLQKFLDITPGVSSNMTIDEEVLKPHDSKHQVRDVHTMIKQKREVDSKVSENDNTANKSLQPVVPKEVEVDRDTNESTLDQATNVVAPNTCGSIKIPFKSEIVGNIQKISDLKFKILMKGKDSEGLYSLYFHNCGENDGLPVYVNLSIAIIEHNKENYLSAGDIPLPKLYFFMSFVFFVTGCIWISVLRKKREETFKIHYLMGLLVFVKSFSLLFHGINYHIISKDGYPMEAWAVLYYITHLLKGALLFITIVLIGTGWAFIKHILSDKDKKIFMIVIPLQVLANVAKIIMEESEEGESQHYTWREIFILVDLLCCGAILFPVVWSIRHLQEASQTDGKAAINLEKLKLFRRFYVMIVCYIYFTRIIVYLLKITVPFQYEWLDELFKEFATLIFFIVTGINFQPTANNPYFRLSQDDQEMDEVITQTGFTENVSKTIRARDTSGQLEESTATKRESSHEYD